MKETLTIQRDLVLGHTDQGVALTADIYLPGTQGLRPGLLLIHGGAWTKGSKEAYQEWGPLLAQAGFAAMAVNYRLSSASYVGWPGALEDVRQTFHWMVDHARSFQIDPRRGICPATTTGGKTGANSGNSRV
jgi:acetyl esterase/lipase